METPIEIDFQGMAANTGVRDSIIKHVSQLEERFGRITAGRVVLKAPGGHHRKGGLYEINIRLTLPEGREVNVDHTAQNDERYSDLNFSINDTFKRAQAVAGSDPQIAGAGETSRRRAGWDRG